MPKPEENVQWPEEGGAPQAQGDADAPGEAGHGPMAGFLALWMRQSPLKFLALAIATVLLLVAHYTTPPMDQSEHDLHRHLLYIPILLAAFWYGTAGGILAAIAISAVYFPHLRHTMHGHGSLTPVLEMLTFLLIGGGTGYMVGRLRGANERLARRSEQLRDAMDNLTVRTREVFEAEEQLRRADRLAALGQLTTGLAHEIRNPLASIRGAAEILGDPGVEPEQRVEFSRVLVEETERLDKVLKHFLDYAKPARQGGDAAAGSDPRRVIERVLTLLCKQITGAGIGTELALAPGLPRLGMAEELLQQVLLNLVLNAVQAMDGRDAPRRLRIEAATMSGSVADAVPGPAPGGGPASPAGWVTLVVIDTGSGIAPGDARNVFNPFFTTKPHGTGLGLAIVHKIVAAHGGTIAIDPEWQGGARILVRVPAAE